MSVVRVRQHPRRTAHGRTVVGAHVRNQAKSTRHNPSKPLTVRQQNELDARIRSSARDEWRLRLADAERAGMFRYGQEGRRTAFLIDAERTRHLPTTHSKQAWLAEVIDANGNIRSAVHSSDRNYIERKINEFWPNVPIQEATEGQKPKGQYR